MNPEPEKTGLSLDELMVTPQWLKAPAQSYEHHTGEERERRRGDRRDDRRPGGGNRDRGERREGPRGPGRPFPKKDGQGGPRPPRGPRRDDRRGPPRPEFRPPPVAALDVEFLPEEKGFAAMLETMKSSVKAYQLFDLAKLILNKPERHVVRLKRLPVKQGEEPGLLYLVDGNETPFLSQTDAVRFVMRQMADKVFKMEKKPVEPPKGNFQFVCKCGMTGEMLGPSTYHGYQSTLVRHHQRRLAHVPFDQFKSRIETVRDPAAVAAWIETMSFVTEYQCAVCPEPKVCSSREEVEKHFVENHLAALITAVKEVTLGGVASRQVASEAIVNCVRLAWEDEMRFPLRTANVIRPRLTHGGFHFFKRNKGVSYVTRIRPKRMESLDHLSPHLQRIILFLREGDGRTGPELVTYLAKPLVPDVEGAEPLPMPILDPDALTRDVHWLVSEGYVVEFSDGRLWAPKEKPPEPQKPEPKAKPAPQPAAPATETSGPAAEVPAPVAETAPSPAVEPSPELPTAE